MNRKARLAWELYLKMETSIESYSLLQLIANDCYKVSKFWNKCVLFCFLLLGNNRVKLNFNILCVCFHEDGTILLFGKGL